MDEGIVTTLQVSGEPGAVEAFLKRVSPSYEPVGMEVLLPPPAEMAGPALVEWKRANWGTPAYRHLGRTSDSRDGTSSEMGFETDSDRPFALAENLAAANPDLTFVIATVDAECLSGEVRVYAGGECHIHEMTSDELGVQWDEDSESYDTDQALRTMLDAFGSAARDYRDGLREAYRTP